ncbi:MAG: tRNA (adenosine(37)-N6)-threonylcarbamoyltransferase complex ATPase subunit type 1 TsaE [Bacteroidales bacterium]|nr:tRNA (adenosine(37)-N6)-threonylcarbamoyltransferase complex ATPase subunit type 1 TsaE [Bacteroidales bacterium]
MQIIIKNTADLGRAAAEFVEYTKGHDIFAFYGHMGAGKTTFIKAITRALGSTDTATSPSFTLVNEYNIAGGGLLYHFDFFRIKDYEEVFDFGFEEYLASGHKCFMEWPEKIEPLLPEETFRVYIRVNDDGSRNAELEEPTS